MKSIKYDSKCVMLRTSPLCSSEELQSWEKTAFGFWFSMENCFCGSILDVVSSFFWSPFIVFAEGVRLSVWVLLSVHLTWVNAIHREVESSHFLMHTGNSWANLLERSSCQGSGNNTSCRYPRRAERAAAAKNEVNVTIKMSFFSHLIDSWPLGTFCWMLSSLESSSVQSGLLGGSWAC